ncbi:PspC domain-containing protein [Hoyosella rhizosphaerae]|uniref:Phage shock protein PspC N-terminal domain-containing protein n=1 Tax=Hoyosella rhizosphaerae TaxID=1755582 RepID=A0A916U9G4_9ACTN|nr:PspC domain-containing protein [Hoyosella rhizosphaerae]MBN4926141.1 PspC domain-containing protein [Hoyosella rhizosphaerae]GGC65222.1 hypothetical protein GCM10011410_17130 [Hoyosella rhizosphaerae]
MATTSFGDQLHDLWRTRPARLTVEGKIAGVCAGFAHRYRVDPALVRVAFVVAAIFGGSGIVLYLLAWLMLPQDTDAVSGGEALLGRGQSSQSQGQSLMLVAGVAITASIFTPLGVSLSGSGVVSLALMLLGWWLLYQRYPTAPQLPPSAFAVKPVAPPIAGEYPAPPGYLQAPGYPPPGTPPPRYPSAQVPFQYGPTPEWTPPYAPLRQETSSAQKNPGGSDSVGSAPVQSAQGENASAESPTHEQAPTPPSWDPLGVAPFAWDLPEPQAPHEPRAAVAVQRKSSITPLTLGVAVTTASVLAAIAFGTGNEWFTAGRIAAIALGVVSLGLIIGAFRNAGYGLLGIAIPLSAFVIVATAVGPVNWDTMQAGVGERNYVVTSLAAPTTDYRLGIGTQTLDLRDLELTNDATVTATTGMGELVIYLPEGVNTVTRCQVRLGESDCPPEGLVVVDDSADAPVLTIDASVTIGTVEARNE